MLLTLSRSNRYLENYIGNFFFKIAAKEVAYSSFFLRTIQIISIESHLMEKLYSKLSEIIQIYEIIHMLNILFTIIAAF